MRKFFFIINSMIICLSIFNIFLQKKTHNVQNCMNVLIKETNISIIKQKLGLFASIFIFFY